MDSHRKIALVTGAARGIGRAIALDLASQGADIVVNYRSRPDAAEKVAEEVRDMGRHALVIKADVADAGQVKSMVDRAVEEFGGIDILVNNAALHRGGRVQKIDPEDWDLVINVALRGAFHCCRHIVPLMVEKRWGRIINISSYAGFHGYPGDTAYGSAKAGIIGFTKSLAKEVAKRGITANVVVPGFLKTDMTAPLFNTEERLKLEIERIPMGRPGEPYEIAEVVSFLAFKGSYVTGAVIMVDGGMGM
ncbi:MAG TPA: 3-oxoacyl-ACP reductase family protein [Desulfatiglandales bacterium]|nr:3-oxoacyl-ACP reductase family protein [Desulfatiglandales bacterium]